MKLTTFLLLVSMCVAAQAQRGTVPRESSQQYPSHAEKQAASIGARLLTQAEARKAFSTDLTHCCLVVEVALFPPKDGTVSVSLDDFVLRTKSKGDELADRPSVPDVVAGMLESQPIPSQPDDRPGVHQTSGVGYESTSVHTPNGSATSRGVILSTGTTVGVGGGGRGPEPGTPNLDRRMAETELRAKGLPEGESATPVSGYLYFPLPAKKDKKAERHLE
ncbi:MAG: hypothetical protein LAP21_10920 [Acidobacteriia bacterium]|nr:hypothetical protein [Terriglobia bacterium]